MRDLLAYRKNLQSLTELIKFTLGADVFVVDDGMVAVAGTGPYRSNIGTRRPHDSYVDVTLNRGDGQTVIHPRYTHQCYRCEYRRHCPYSMVICRPLINQNRIKGLIGFLSFSENQRQNLINRSSFLCDISERLGYFWETADLDQHLFLGHPGTRSLIDFFEEGSILTTSDYDVINLNQRAALEKRQIHLALETYGHHTEGKRRAARHLGISLSTLYRKMAGMGCSNR